MHITSKNVDKTVMKEVSSMIYGFGMEKIPKIVHIYTVTRKTVWQVADQYNILLIILDGVCSVEMNKESFTLRAGDVLFIPKGESYKRTPVDDTMTKMLYVHFTVADEIREYSQMAARAALEELKLDIRSSLLPEKQFFPEHTANIFISTHFRSEGDLILKTALEIEKLLPVFRASDALFISLKFCEILSYINKKTVKSLNLIEADVGISAVPQKLKRAVFYIRQNENKKVALGELCRVAAVSESQLIRYFKTAFGKTPNEYIREYKINRAREIFLTAPELSVGEVASLLGFDDAHYFTRSFSKITGETPSNYRYRVTHFTPDAGEKK